MEKRTLDVKGMTCGHCKMSVEEALTKLEGVSSAEVDLEAGNVVIDFDESTVTVDTLKETIEDQGYDVA